jgi:uncharacterized membrane protein YobD (UPF0266 family)
VTDKPLGRRIATHPIAPAAVQRAAFIAILSFLFFLGMMFAFYLLQHIGYFLLGTGFLLVYMMMMYSVVMQRKSAVEVHERGFHFKKTDIAYDDVDTIDLSGEVTLKNGKKLALPKSLLGFDVLIATLRSRSG